MFSPGGVEIVWAPGGFVAERGSPYVLPEKRYEVVVRDCGVGTMTPIWVETEEEEEEEYVPASHAATPTPASTTSECLPPKKKKKRGKRS